MHIIRAEQHIPVTGLAWLCPQTRVGQFLRDLLLKSMTKIQGDGNIIDRSHCIKSAINLGVPNTLNIDLKIIKQFQRGAHTERCYRPELHGKQEKMHSVPIPLYQGRKLFCDAGSRYFKNQNVVEIAFL